MHAIDHANLTGPSYQHNHHRVEKQGEIETAISGWTKRHSIAEVEEVMQAAGVPVGRVANVKDIVESEHVKVRGAVRSVEVNSNGKDGRGTWNVKMQGTFPVLDDVDPQPKWAGPDLGFHTDEVLMGNLGLSLEAVSKLRDEGVIV
jgi:crotonobetainyl-CoA:carnitine CoA-transferase CaiB-like acyl-CoA transferase